jgi:hypothetical protein
MLPANPFPQLLAYWLNPASHGRRWILRHHEKASQCGAAKSRLAEGCPILVFDFFKSSLSGFIPAEDISFSPCQIFKKRLSPLEP